MLAAGSIPPPSFAPQRDAASPALKVCLMGTPVSSGNRGVLALSSSLVNLCCGAAENVEVVLLVGQRDCRPVQYRVAGRTRTVRVVNCRLSPRSRPADHLLWIILMALLYRLAPWAAARRALARSTPWTRAIAEADLVGDVRGGDSFSDIYGMRRFVRGFLMAWSVILVRGSLVQFPQTFGPFRSPLARWMAGYILRRSSVILARDMASLKLAGELAGSQERVLLSPDVAFCLEPAPVAEVELDPPPARAADRGRSAASAQLGASGALGLNVNALMYHGGYTRDNMFGLRLDYASFLPALVEALLREHRGEIWLVPHNFAPAGSVESDPDVCRRLRDELPAGLCPRVRIVARSYDQHEIKTVIGQCHFFVGSRMHACIAALSQGVPCVGVAYSGKFAGVFQTVGMEEWVVDGREATAGESVLRVLDLYRRRDEVRDVLRRRGGEARLRLRQVFGESVRRLRERRGA